MDSIISAIQDWIKEMLVGGIMSNLSGMFDAVNQQVAEIAGDVGTTPANFSPGVYAMIRNMGYTVLLVFTLFKTGAIARSVFNAH